MTVWVYFCKSSWIEFLWLLYCHRTDSTSCAKYTHCSLVHILPLKLFLRHFRVPCAAAALTLGVTPPSIGRTSKQSLTQIWVTPEKCGPSPFLELSRNFFLCRNDSNGFSFEYLVRNKDGNVLPHSGFTASLLCEGLKICDDLWI